MCGIVGIVYFDGRQVVRQPLEAAAETLVHRGPDASGIYIDNDRGMHAGLGHRRLSIIDLSASANQPLSNENGDVWIVFNGEIYNFPKLKNQLKQTHTFVSNSDTEVIVHLYEQYGEDALAMLDGMFALALYDRRNQRLILARDRAGKKPLYYYHDGRTLIFGSEIKAILALLQPEEKAVNEQMIPFYLVYGYARPPQTFYKGIRQLAPAQYAVCTGNGTMDLREYWSLKQHILDSDADARNFAQVDPMLRFKLTGAVKNRLMSDVPLGAFLSGGVDSSIVTGLMSRLTDAPVKTFSIGFSEDARYDETSYAALVAKKFNTDHHTFVVTPSTIDLIQKLIYHYDEPFGDASAIPTYIVSNLTRQHVTVALTGDGGDELFAGYTRFIAATLSERVPGSVRKLLYNLSGMIPLSHSERSIPARAKRLFSVFNQPLLERYINWVSYIRFDDTVRLMDPGVFPASGQEASRDAVSSYFSQHLKGLEKASLLTQLLYLNFKTYLPDDLLVKMDRMSMANSLEGRSPFLDRELVEYAFTMPDNLKLKGFTTKYSLKQTFQDILPREVLRRGKMGFGVPLGAWFRTKLRDYLRDHLLSDDAQINTYLRTGEVRRIFDEHQQGVRDNGLKLWLLLTLELWLRNLKKGTRS